MWAQPCSQTCSDPSLRTWVMFMEQYLGPHMEQKWAVLAGSCGGLQGTGKVLLPVLQGCRHLLDDFQCGRIPRVGAQLLLMCGYIRQEEQLCMRGHCREVHVPHLGQGGVVVHAGSHGVQAQVELVLPARRAVGQGKESFSGCVVPPSTGSSLFPSSSSLATHSLASEHMAHGTHQRNSKRALDSSLSRRAARGWPCRHDGWSW